MHPAHQGSPLHCRLRYFDPVRRRPGMPEDVAALVEKLTADTTVLTLVNVNQSEPRTVVVQGGAYGEHQFASVEIPGRKASDDKTPATMSINDSHFTVRLAPGAGEQLILRGKRYANSPTIWAPWER
jgi:hypothetical protein